MQNPGVMLEKCPLCGDCCGECTCLPEEQRPVARPGMLERIKEDVRTAFDKDPAARSTLEILTCYPGLHALWMHRLAHALWERGLRFWGRFVSHISRWLTGIEIHPGARIGRRVFIDHGMGVVIGETAEVGDDVLIYMGVVLGGVSLEKTKRHPTVGDGVILGSGAIVLGPIEVGYNARIGSGSVVIDPVPPCATVVGIPGRVVKINGKACKFKPDLHHERLPDVMTEALEQMRERVQTLEARLAALETQAEPAKEKEEVTSWT